MFSPVLSGHDQSGVSSLVTESKDHPLENSESRLSEATPATTNNHAHQNDSALGKQIPTARSYSNALQGTRPSPKPVLNQWIPVSERDIVPLMKNGIKSLSLSKEFKEKLCQPWSNSVIV
ncbi:hypothetical protein LINPERHAP1_LOCUS40281 [Linum perenne]